MNLDDYLPTLAGIIIAALIGYMGARFAATSTMKVGKETNAVEWSGDLLQEVRSLRTDLKKVEAEVRTLRSDLDAVTGFFNTAVEVAESFMSWVLGGCKGPMPRIAKSIRKHFNEDLLEAYELHQQIFSDPPPKA